MNTPSAKASPRTRAFVAWTLRHGRLLWLVALVLAAPAAWRTASLYANLQSALEKLLPTRAPSVVAINELRARSPGLQHLGVIVDTGDAAHLKDGERLIDDLATRIRAYPPDMVRAVRVGDAAERAFIEEHSPLYVEPGDLRTILKRIEDRKEYEVSKAAGSLLDDDEAPPPLDFSDIEAKYKGRVEQKEFPNNRFSSPELHATLLLIEVGGFSSGNERGKVLLSRVQADLAALGGPQAYGPGFTLGYTGDVAISVEETTALLTDLSMSSLLVLAAVIAVLLVYYRWWRSVVILLLPLLLATVYSFGLASLPPFGVTELNSNTAFLGSIIVGNGINFGIILLARYVEDRRKGMAVDEALVSGVDAAKLGTLAAALAAGASYASLSLTEFRGFAQFGHIGGIGMVMAWVVTFVLMPPLTAWLDSGEKAAPPPLPERTGLMRRVATGVARAPGLIAIIAVAISAAAAWQVRKLGPDQLEYDMSRLRRADTWTSGEGYWGRKMDKLLGQYLTPMVILADDPEQARRIGAGLREASSRPPLAGMLATVRLADDVLPPAQPEKIEITRKIRAAITPRVRSLLTDEQRKALDRVMGKGELSPITAADLPPTFTVAMRERDGRIDRTVLVYPVPSDALWQGPRLIAFVDAVKEAAARGGGPPGSPPARVAGGLPLSADILRSIQHDGILASAAALLGVVLVVFALFRFRATTGFVIGSLLVGVLWLIGAMLALRVKINFANFIAFPITFGIGVDYAVNVMSRYDHDGTGDVTEAIASTGGAVGLCSATTIIGYSSLLLAENRALYLFGLVAVMGEIACLLTAVTVLPACLLLLQRRRANVVEPAQAG
jgi:uncharacterized protein